MAVDPHVQVPFASNLNNPNVCLPPCNTASVETRVDDSVSTGGGQRNTTIPIGELGRVTTTGVTTRITGVTLGVQEFGDTRRTYDGPTGGRTGWPTVNQTHVNLGNNTEIENL
uniref:Uncharacterized protein n=1 Tax=Cannabis sativa TaxID=3483 RepID=A0A803P2H4_CANSA